MLDRAALPGCIFKCPFTNSRQYLMVISGGPQPESDFVKVVQVILVFVVQECEIHHEKLWSEKDSLRIQYFL